MCEEILPNLFRLKIPLPDSPLKNLNSYVIKGSDRNLTIDTGLNRRECLAAMQAGLNAIGIDLKASDIFSTHLHADHFGLVTELATDTSRVYFSRPEKELIESWDQFPVAQKWFATGEAISHLRYLEEEGQLLRNAGGNITLYGLVQ